MTTPPGTHPHPGRDVPWAMQIVVRVERDPAPDHTAVLRATASAVATALAAFTAPEADPVTRARTERWRSGPIRKVVRRARGAGWDRQLAVPGVRVHHVEYAGEPLDVAVHVPGPVDQVHPEIARLQVGGLNLEDRGLHLPDADVRFWLNPHVTLTTGKAAAQVGHASQLTLQALPVEAAASWVDSGAPVDVCIPADTEWEGLLAASPVVVTDGGFTEVAPGTVTVVAAHPWGRPQD